MRKAGAPSCFYSAACRSEWCSTSVNLIQTLHHYTAGTASSKLNKPITDLQSLCISFFCLHYLILRSCHHSNFHHSRIMCLLCPDFNQSANYFLFAINTQTVHHMEYFRLQNSNKKKIFRIYISEMPVKQNQICSTDNSSTV